MRDEHLSIEGHRLIASELKRFFINESNKYVASVREFAAKENCEVFVICAQIEQEISELDDDEKKMFLEDLGISSSGLDKLIGCKLQNIRSYKLLNCW